MSTFSLYSKRFVGWVLTMLLLVVIVSLSRNAWDLWNLRSRVTDDEAEHQALVNKKQEMERKYQEQTSPFAKEREIRDKLNMAKPGEEVLIVPEELRQAPSIKPQAPLFQDEVHDEELPNWKKWWRVINPDIL